MIQSLLYYFSRTREAISKIENYRMFLFADQIRVKRQTLEDQPSSSWFQRRHRYRRYRARDSQGHSRGACGDEAAAGDCRDHATHDAANRKF